MKILRRLNRLALLGGLGLSLVVALGQGRSATALVCPGGAPQCSTPANCASYCQAQTGSPGAICNRVNCCVCLVH
jgi:hypothetical protein